MRFVITLDTTGMSVARRETVRVTVSQVYTLL